MVVLITGTAGGIGRATAQYFLDMGHEVHGLDILPGALTHERYFHYIADVRNPESFPEGIFPEILVNCAGV